ncbi:uncharacterized protein LOC135486096 [Lineus longissimus]|uniref:uncharacterized protein LOC135486096 n=1 Tax=Lineus longissimus TaxID=88925 RepID=UPI002B4CB042
MNRLGVVCFLAILYISGTYGLKCKKCEQTTNFNTPNLAECKAAATEDLCVSPNTKCGAVVDATNSKTVFGCFTPAKCSDATLCCGSDDCNQAITGGNVLPTTAAATTAASPSAGTGTTAAAAAAATTAKTGGAATPAVSLGVLVLVTLIAASKVF